MLWTPPKARTRSKVQIFHYIYDDRYRDRRLSGGRTGRRPRRAGRRHRGRVDRAHTAGALRWRSAGARGRGHGYDAVPAGAGRDAGDVWSAQRPAMATRWSLLRVGRLPGVTRVPPVPVAAGPVRPDPRHIRLRRWVRRLSRGHQPGRPRAPVPQRVRRSQRWQRLCDCTRVRDRCPRRTVNAHTGRRYDCITRRDGVRPHRYGQGTLTAASFSKSFQKINLILPQTSLLIYNMVIRKLQCFERRGWGFIWHKIR